MATGPAPHTAGDPRRHGAPSADVLRWQSDLLAWYAAHKRDLPWRDVDDPYAVWVSEIMLQQTRVATAERYFAAWMSRFPTVASLAEADVEDVLRAWQGLGYYRRARNLHRAARRLAKEHGACVPRTARELQSLPGVGPYTAGAIASIAFGEAVPAVDGNARRVLARLTGEREDPTRGAASQRIREIATALADHDRPGDVNQALMELGATICVPRTPCCRLCPLQDGCAALRSGLESSIPSPRPRAAPKEERRSAVAVRDADGRWLVARRREGSLLGGLWELPIGPPGDAAAATRAFERRTGIHVADLQLVGEIVHVFTHLRQTISVYRGSVAAAGGSEPADRVRESAPGDAGLAPYDELRWVSRDALSELPTSVRMDKLMAVADG